MSFGFYFSVLGYVFRFLGCRLFGYGIGRGFGFRVLFFFVIWYEISF